jgi:hypothetical protein
MSDAGTYSARIVIENNTDRPRIVWVEPWGDDFTLRPKEGLEVVARNGSESLWFQVVEYNEGCQVYIEGSLCNHDVWQDGQVIHCGHQRQVAIDAGLTL